MHRHILLTWLLAWLLTACLPLSATAVEPVPSGATGSDTPVVAEIQAEIERLEKAPEKDNDAALALKLNRQALDFLQQAVAEAARADSHRRELDSAADEEKRLAELLDAAPRLPEAQSEATRVWDAADLDTLVGELNQRRAALESTQSEVNDLTNEAAQLQTRATQRGTEIATDKARLGELQQALSKLGGDSAQGTVERARSAQVRAEAAALKARLEELRLEGVAEPTRKKQTGLRVREAQQRLQVQRTLAGALEDLIGEWRHKDAEQARSSTARTEIELADEHPLLKAAASENTRLGRHLAEISDKLDHINDLGARERRRLTTLDTNYRRVTLQLSVTGKDQAVGRYLFTAHEKLNRFLNLKEYERQTATHTQDLGDARLHQLEVDASLADLRNLDDAVANTLTEQAGSSEWQALEQAEREHIAATLGQLLTQRSELLKKLTGHNNHLIQGLNELIQAEQQVADKSAQLRELIEQNLWFLPSNAPVSLPWFASFAPSLAWLSNGESWSATGATFLHAASDRLLLTTGLLVFIGGLWVARRRLKQRLRALAVDVGSYERDRFGLTAEAVLVTVALSTPLPLLTLIIGLALTLGPHPDPDAFGLILGRALMNAWFYLFALLFIRNLLRAEGLAQLHFGWRNRVLQVLRKNLAWYIPSALLLFLVTAMTRLHWVASGSGSNDDHLGRSAFVLMNVLLVAFLWRVLDPRQYIAPDDRSQTPLWRTAWLVLATVFAASVALIGGAIAGYYYTTLFLYQVLYDSLLVVIGVYLLYALALRWFTLTQRRLDYQRQREQAIKDAKERARQQAADQAGEALPNLDKEKGVDLKEISSRVQRFLRLLLGLGILFGLAWVWQSVAPVFGSLDDVLLWEHRAGEGASATLISVTLQDLAIALAIIALTVTAARNLPGILEVAYLERMGIKSGNRYAITQIVRYTVYTGGLLWTLSHLGVSWGDVQWLVAAMGVGLGFGLKEIFANFISGLIILFERPIRVGDTITVGNISGVVARIRIRASTITDWDNKELVVPNQILLTDSIINWTLSSTVTRVVFRVGVAYGSDPERVHAIMLEAIQANPMVLDEPKPSVFFVGFGESSLDFEIRVFVADRFNRTPLLHALHIALNRALNEAGIEIPFPQRDIHVGQLQGPTTKGPHDD